MKSADLKKEVSVTGKYIYDPSRHPEGGLVKYCSPYAMTIEKLMEGLIDVNRMIEMYIEARDNMEKIISDNLSA